MPFKPAVTQQRVKVSDGEIVIRKAPEGVTVTINCYNPDALCLSDAEALEISLALNLVVNQRLAKL